MARPRQLVGAVANSFAMPTATIVVHDRNLSEAKLRSTDGRGSAVARVTYGDASNLLIAVAGSRSVRVRDSVAIVRAYAPLVNTKGCLFLGLDDEHPEYQPRGMTFGDGLTALLEAFGDGSDGGALRRAPDLHFEKEVPIGVVVTLSGPEVRARIEIWQQGTVVSAADYGEGVSRVYNLRRSYVAPSRRRQEGGDLEYSAGFTEETLRAVGSVVSAADRSVTTE